MLWPMMGPVGKAMPSLATGARRSHSVVVLPKLKRNFTKTKTLTGIKVVVFKVETMSSKVAGG